MKIRLAVFAIAVLLVLFVARIATAQTLHVTYICNGERMFIENCNIRDLSDTATCMVGHPDTVLSNGLMKYTYETRGALKKLFPTCKQPSADEVARAKARDKKQNDIYEANVKKANEENDAIEARAQAVITGKKPQTPEERAMNRCITSGRLPASCTGNAMLGAFTQMLSSVSSILPTETKESISAASSSGPNMAGVFQGAGGWRLDFIDSGVLVNCSILAPDEHKYSIDFKNDRTTIVIDTTPKPLVLTFRPDGTISGPGPFVIDGVVNAGYKSDANGSAPSGYHDRNGIALSNSQVSPGSEVYDGAGNRVYSPTVNQTGHTVFAPKRVTCPALNLSTKGASVGVQTMQTDLLKTMFGGDKGPPTPPGIRMHGIFAAPTGFSVQFFPESVILGCGPDAARAYPYSVMAGGTKAVIQVATPDHPLTLNFQADGTLNPDASGPYQVHGRTVIGQNGEGDFNFAPLEQTCNLAPLTPSKTIPSGSAPAALTASAGTPATATANRSGSLSTPNAPTGNAVLTIVSGFPAQPDVLNPLAGHPYVLLRDDYDTALKKGGIAIPAGMTGPKLVASTCTTRTPECQKALAAITSDAASAVRADITGKAAFPGVPPGSYYLMISTQYNKQNLSWGFKVDLHAGTNTITLDQRNAIVMQ
ncbi:MAG TPA: hypothetical protein VLA42_12690 [Verrucomicrobiae bacterium]|jgi:hypothetical protein|nr:hypothetical protein [Verrucomicrobiae bacterium]